MNIREKVTARIDSLQEMMETNSHLDSPDAAVSLLYRITPFWSILSEEDRDYVQAAQGAIEDKTRWEGDNTCYFILSTGSEITSLLFHSESV